MEPTPKSIFNFTEITTFDTEKQASLLPYLTKTPKTASSGLLKPINTTKSQTSRTSASWVAFTQRNLTSPKAPSPSKLESLISRVSQDLEMPSTRSGTQIMSWELESNLGKEITALQKIVTLKQKQYNKVKDEADRKEELLKRLKFELSCMQKDPIDELNITLNRRQLEFNEIQKALHNENYYIETLNHMLRDRKRIVLTTEPPVLNMKNKVYVEKREITELENSIERHIRETGEILKNIQMVNEEIEHLEKCKEEEYQKHLARLKQRKILEGILEKEYSLNTKMHLHEKLEMKIKKLEPILSKIEKDEEAVAGHESFLKYQEILEKRYLKMKEVSFASKIEEIFESYEILREHTEMLEIAAVQSLNRIDMLSSEHKKVTTELNDISLNHEDDRKINYKEFERIELSLKDKNKMMDENERILTNLGTVMGSLCSSVTRLSLQLLGTNSLLDVKPRNVVKYFTKCTSRIEDKLNMIFAQRLSDYEVQDLNKRFPGLMQAYMAKQNSLDLSIKGSL
ncbi:hypothetical protein SteCoe_32266 [Stentor coeruleus]|uniref:Uncharacterized protein n=1 Tax=Stentor coeruleus TaxID=5963 RepID=A0A1R2AZF7_9CILI|nr:hypothetical protein SteCoe_32266 [Stentor coeruleus]